MFLKPLCSSTVITVRNQNSQEYLKNCYTNSKKQAYTTFREEGVADQRKKDKLSTTP
jgi:hypothetical protein